MIIGLSIHDNDYSVLMEKFSEQIGMGNFILESPDGTPDWYNWHRVTQRALCNIVKLDHPSDEDKTLFSDIIQRSWRAYTKPYKNNYLTDILEITFPENITAQWQNGEQFYVFPTSYTGKILSF